MPCLIVCAGNTTFKNNLLHHEINAIIKLLSSDNPFAILCACRLYCPDCVCGLLYVYL